MRPLSLFLLALAVVASLGAQGPAAKKKKTTVEGDPRWARVDSLRDKGLYRSALELVILIGKDARAKGATPVLFTPIVRRKFNAHGALEDTHGAYPLVVREVARDLNVAFVDLQMQTEDLVRGAGPEGSKKLYVWVAPGDSKMWRFHWGRAAHLERWGRRPTISRRSRRSSRRRRRPRAPRC